jgi:putative transposase
LKQIHCPYVIAITPVGSVCFYHVGVSFERTFFVTTVTWQRIPLFRDRQKAQLMLEVLMHYRQQNRYLLHEYVIMPDHLHLLLTPARDISLERAVQLIKGGFSFRLGKSKRGLVCQESFTNHRIRDDEDYARHAEYIRMNPVRGRLVESAEAYPYSSANPQCQVEERPLMAARGSR